MQIKKYSEAISDCNKAIEIDKFYSAAYEARGMVKEALGDVKGALEDYNKGKEIESLIS